jgi:hypothetical protein
LHGKIIVRDRGKQQTGTVFEVQLPARQAAPQAAASDSNVPVVKEQDALR